jgi:hypothetical protein
MVITGLSGESREEWLRLIRKYGVARPQMKMAACRE